MIGAAAVAAAVVWFAPRLVEWNGWLIAALGVGAALTAEVAVEVVEYPLRYADNPNLTAYYDTVADLTSSLVGAFAGAFAAAAVQARRARL